MIDKLIKKIVDDAIGHALEKTLEKSISTSKQFSYLVEDVNQISDSLKKLAKSFIAITSTIYAHQQAIEALNESQQYILTMLQEKKPSSSDPLALKDKNKDDKKPN